MTSFLNPLDSSFILLENPGTSMNIGAVIELESDENEDPRQRFERIQRNVGDRLCEIPVFCQRVVRAPFDMTWPIMVRDEKFDLDRHVLRVVLPSPGSSEQFDQLVSDFLSRTLSPQRPLWQLLVIEGLESGRFAAVLKVHHSLADGVSGAEVFANLFDITPDVRAPHPLHTEPSTSEESSVTTSRGLLRLGMRRLWGDPSLVLDAVAAWGGRLYEIMRALYLVTLARGRRAADQQPSIFEARRTSLNGAANIEKVFCQMRVPLADVKRVAKARDASVTDFVITVCSGALRQLLHERGEELRRDLIAFVPINVRGEGSSASLGNRISGMLVRLHTDVVDREQRLRAISSDAKKTLGPQREHRAKIFHDVPRVLGPTLLSLGGKIIAAFGLFDRLPMANLMISSVPGPPVQLWLSGHRVLSAAPFGPLLGAFSLNITVLGFEEYLEFGLLGCADQMPDLARLRDLLREEACAFIGATGS